MEKSIFDDWSDVKDCNKCQEYWNDTCDGSQIGVERPCKAFKATRSVDIPLKIKSLESALKCVHGLLTILAIGWFLLMVVTVFG